MLAAFVIVLREALEAALVVAVVVGYLRRTDQTRSMPWVVAGVAAGVGLSLAGAFAFDRLAGGFEGRAEEVFEGVVMLAGAFLLSTMILWMMRHDNASKELEERASRAVGRYHSLGLFLLVLLSILREGVETVVFLAAAATAAQGYVVMGAVLGLVAALALAYLLFRGTLSLRLRTFFAVTNALLILFAAGLVSHGIHELQEAGVLPTVIEHLWDINPPLRADGSYPPLHEGGFVGSLAAGLFGYNGNPSLIEVLAWAGYLLAAAGVWVGITRSRSARRHRVKQVRSSAT